LIFFILKDHTREFVSKVGEDLKQKKAEADDMTSEMDTVTQYLKEESE
jgi:hypothetical protein